jgi:nucleotide-binding universal stress UspA family protein
MFRTILVPLDGSAQAEKALPVAARIARSIQGKLLLVRAVSLATEYWPAMMTPYPSIAQAAVDGELTEAEQYLRQVAMSKPLTGISVETVVQFGPAAPSILAAAAAHTVDLIVMGSHGFTGIGHWMLGSVAEKVVRHAPVPVLLWRADAALPQTGLSDVGCPLRILVPLDGSEYADAALEPAAELVCSLKDPSQKGALHLARIVKPPERDKHDEMYTAQTRRGLNKAKQFLSRITELIREGYIAPTIAKQQLMVNWSVAIDHDVASALVRLAESGEDMEGAGSFGGCSVIAIATHGRSGFQHWTMGSITERVLHATRLPLLVVRPTEATKKAELSWEEMVSVL